MRIYIAGPMTGLPDHNIPAFEAAAKKLRDEGHFVINPVKLATTFGKLYDIAASFATMYGDYRIGGNISPRLAQSIIDADLAAVRSCNAIFLLKGWERSRGAKKELAEAITHGLTIMLEEAE